MTESPDFGASPGTDDDVFDAIILGAGITGLVSASVLHDLGCRKIAVLDEFGNLGGNHIDRSINGYTFDIGSLIFQDDSPLLDHFPELLEHYVPIMPTWGKLTPQAVVTSYPLSIKDDIIRSGAWGIFRIALSVAISRLFRRKIGNAREFAQYWIGDYLLRRSGLESYMKRFFGVPADGVDLEFAEKRMLWIKEHARPRVLLRYVRRHRADRSDQQATGAAPRRLHSPSMRWPRGPSGSAAPFFIWASRSHRSRGAGPGSRSSRIGAVSRPVGSSRRSRSIGPWSSAGSGRILTCRR